MSNRVNPPQYLLIALDIANRIAKEELVEDKKLSGRSLFASEYNVSPETIRRALKLLADMKVVDIKHNSGVYVLSIDNAKRYIEHFDGFTKQVELQKDFENALAKQKELNQQLESLAAEIIRKGSAFASVTTPFVHYEIKIPVDSEIIGENIGKIKFWQETGATIVAIKRANYMILSPGPYAELYANDTIIFVGNEGCHQAVSSFLNRKEEEK